MTKTTDPVESVIQTLLDDLGIEYTRPDQQKPTGHPPLDFYLPAFDLYIECKAWMTERAVRQLRDCNNVVVVVGVKGAEALSRLLR